MVTYRTGLLKQGLKVRAIVQAAEDWIGLQCWRQELFGNTAKPGDGGLGVVVQRASFGRGDAQVAWPHSTDRLQAVKLCARLFVSCRAEQRFAIGEPKARILWASGDQREVERSSSAKVAF